jgi:hypothetical protein
VLPIKSSTLSARRTGTGSLLASAGNRWNDGNVVAILDRGVQLVEEPDVVTVNIDINEAADFAFFIQQPIPHPGMAALEIINNVLKRGTRGDYFAVTGGESAQRSGHANPNCHLFTLPPIVLSLR